MKKIVSVLIVLTLLVNIAGFGFLNIKAAAEVLAAGIGAIISVIQTGLGGAAECSSSIIENSSPGNVLEGFGDFYTYHHSSREIEYVDDMSAYDGFIGVTVENNIATFLVDPNCASEQLEFANRLVSRLNGIFPRNRYVNDDGNISASLYAAIKTNCVDEYNKYIAEKGAWGAEQAMIDAGLFPDYGFDWTGPVDPLHVPPRTIYKPLSSKGLIFTAPMVMSYNGRFAQPNTAGFYGYENDGNEKNDNGYRYKYHHNSSMETVYGLGYYIIYNNEIYRYAGHFKDEPLGADYITSAEINSNNFAKFKNSAGLSLLDAGCTSVVGLRAGFYVSNVPKSQLEEPKNISETDFIEEVGGGDIPTPPLTDEELAIIQAIAAGLLPEDFMLKFDELGKIIAANNIPIETLKNLLQQIKDGQMKFENFESYLAAISAMLKAGNVDRQTSNAILANIAALQEKTNGDINVLNTAISGLKELDQERNDTLARIEANTAAIAEAITAGTIISAGTEFDVRTPSIITDKFPFSLPFDIYHIYNLLSAEPQAPHWEIPIEMEGVYEYTIDVDLSEYEWIANIVRWLMYAIFIVGLILVTNKLIGRG